MPLPDNPKAPWPPPTLKRAYQAFDQWGAWYSGEPEELMRVYGGSIGYGGQSALVGPEGTVLGRARQRWFWGQRLGGVQDLADARLHIPLAGDIATTSADLLFSEPPAITVEGEDGGRRGNRAKPTTDRLMMLLTDGGFLPVLIEGAEICASSSGVFLRAGWVDDIADHVLIDAIRPDCAVPEWVAGRLRTVTFWKQLPGDDKKTVVWRHLEHHETDGSKGRVLHALYRGTQSEIGEAVDLSDHPHTERLAKASEATRDSGLDRHVRQIITGADRIAVEWVPNMRPPRKLRGTAYGRSDYDGIEPVLDAADEAWSSWLRDIRIGKGRIVVPESYLQNQGRGRGALFDAEQAVFSTVDALPAKEGMGMQVVQFAIRVAEHKETVVSLVAEALRGAGYSTQTFGLAGEVAATATEVVARERRSYITRGRKLLYWRPALARLLETALQIDVAHFKPDKVKAVRPRVVFPDGVAQDPQTAAQVVALIHGAEAASLYTRIAMVNPDWEDAQIREEIDRIREDQRVSAKITTPPVAEPGTGATQPGAGTDEPEQAAAASGGGPTGEDPGPGGPQPPQQQELVVKAGRRPPTRRPPAPVRR